MITILFDFVLIFIGIVLIAVALVYLIGGHIKKERPAFMVGLFAAFLAIVFFVLLSLFYL